MGAALGRFLRRPLPRTPTILDQNCGALAQLGERLICIQEVSGSIPLGSTKLLVRKKRRPNSDFAQRNASWSKLEHTSKQRRRFFDVCSKQTDQIEVPSERSIKLTSFREIQVTLRAISK